MIMLTIPALTLALLGGRIPAPAPPATIELRRGLVITRSAKITRDFYPLEASSSLDSAVIIIRGSHIVLDLNGSTLDGAPAGSDPDQAAGIAIRVESGSDITIENGSIHGYRFNILARGTVHLTLKHLDLSRSWKPRLYSLVEHESLVDWLSFHHNENREWLRFGAAAYLEGVRGGEVSRVTAEQGMNGLMLVRSDSLNIHGNTIRFNSGLGIGLYRSSDNLIVHNRLDYNVRGYSNGFYWRGQDSANLLLFEQSRRNTVAYNSATHGGDGLFLWAGQSTMDTGKGGASDNLFYGNDFSFAPANAMEATFSSNTFVGNRAEGSDYGFWGGYSWGTHVVGNCFVGDRIGVAIEHGQENVISRNRFDRLVTGIRLWGDTIQPGDWGYPKGHDTESRDTWIHENLFTRTRVGVSIADSREVDIRGNSFTSVDTAVIPPDTAFFRSGKNAANDPTEAFPVDVCASIPPLEPKYTSLAPDTAGSGGKFPASTLARRDRSAIIVSEWGPYDWRTPILWPVDSTRAVPLRLAVLGPAGSWTVVARRGIAALSATEGRMNDTITVTPHPDSVGDWALGLVYDPNDTGMPVPFGYAAFEPVRDWQVKAFVWTDSTDPRSKPSAFAALLKGTPIMTARASRLDYMWYRSKIAALPQEKWALEATSSVILPPGVYTLRTISDDGVRVWVNDRLLIDDWTPHESAVDVVGLPGGRYELRVEYYQVDGWSELRLDILRGIQRAGGSPGPH
jgi:parallel beta-helix repeat protein